MNGADPEAVLVVIDGFSHNPPDAQEQIELARELLPRNHFQAVETLLWKSLCLAREAFARPEQIVHIVSLLDTFPKDYGLSPRLVITARLMKDLPGVARELFRWADKLSRSVARSLASPSHAPHLIRIVETRCLYPKDSPGAGWTPLHAMRILAEIGSPAAVPALVRGMLDPEIFDYAQKELALALGRIGTPALGPILESLQSPGLDEFQMITMLRVLRDVAIVDDSSRPRVAEHLLHSATDASQPPEVRAFGVRYLIEMNAREHQGAIDALLNDSFFSRGVAVSPERLRDQWRSVSARDVLDRRQAILDRFASLYPES
jgi:hypothetical protein